MKKCIYLAEGEATESVPLYNTGCGKDPDLIKDTTLRLNRAVSVFSLFSASTFLVKSEAGEMLRNGAACRAWLDGV